MSGTKYGQLASAAGTGSASGGGWVHPVAIQILQKDVIAAKAIFKQVAADAAFVSCSAATKAAVTGAISGSFANY